METAVGHWADKQPKN